MNTDTLNGNDLLERIEKSLDKIRPYLEADGGNVKVLEITTDMVLRLELLGACGNCPMSTMTMKAGIEETIKRDLPELKEVEAINITSTKNPNAKLPN
ncbi:MAG: NifU family protein [Cyclobacteriaceae bacterium]|nr:NifU family protein [Cyclobacteriaceae bacterium]